MIGSSKEFSRRLVLWYHQHRRDLPWRLPMGAATDQTLNPYHVIVSEAMLQQTQVATVIPYFYRFIEKFPTVLSLAEADTQEVLRAWQGLGYYSRARNLQLAAKTIASKFGGQLPATAKELLTLPGVGRYTAGAVSSIAFGQRSPILDGNVVRVICRLDKVQTDPREAVTRGLLWSRAEEILPRKNVGDFNSALMELGALICTPKSPQCLLCPVQTHCEAAAAGLQEKIPLRKASKPTPLFDRWTFCIRHGDRYLIEQRPEKGRWASMWQFVTMGAGQTKPTSALIQSHYSLRTSKPIIMGTVEHSLTHRRYRFDAFTCELTKPAKNLEGKWVTLQELDEYPLPLPHLKIAAMLKQQM